MIEITIRGRGGQGCVTTAELLANAAFFDGKQAQAFPFFGVERTGAPIKAFCRIAPSEERIRLHQHVYEADYVIVLDSSLAEESNVFNHLKPKAMAVIASRRAPNEFKPPNGVKVTTVDAYKIARETIGKPFVNAAMLGAFAKSTGLVTLDAIEKAIRKRFSNELAEKNVQAARKCYETVS